MITKKVVLVDPHLTDEFFTPIRFFLKRRKGLGKYSYFTKIDDVTNVALTFEHSGIVPSKIFRILPYFFKALIVLSEYYIWKVLQKRHITLVSLDKRDIAIYLLRNANEFSVDYLRKKGVLVAWLMSHYHLAKEHIGYVENEDLILADNLMALYNDLESTVHILPAAVKSRFRRIKPFEERSQKVIATGTIHLYSKPFNGSVKYKKHHTMHPSRADVYFSESLIFEKNFSIISDSDNLYSAQRGYMSQDIVEIYNNHKYAFVGSEAEGIFALGAIEAMCCGCELFIEEDIGIKLGLIDGETAWFFDGTSDSLERVYAFVIENRLSLDVSKIDSFVKRFTSNELALLAK